MGNIVEKRRNCSFRSNFSSFFTIFCYILYLLLDSILKTGNRFSFRDKRLVKISEVEK